MKQSFRLYRRNGVYYCQDNATGKQESLHTDDKVDAGRILHAKNEAGQMGTLNLQIARAYMVASDPLMPERTWRDVIRSIIDEKTGPTRTRWENTEKDKALAALWNLPVVQTRADQLLKMLRHLHGGLARDHHDVLLRFANGFGDDFGQRGQQGLLLILSQRNGSFES